jgi:hypothetical protein
MPESTNSDGFRFAPAADLLKAGILKALEACISARGLSSVQVKSSARWRKSSDPEDGARL